MRNITYRRRSDTDYSSSNIFFLSKLFFFLVGPSGSGKTFITVDLMTRLSTDTYINNIINFSARTSENYTQGTLTVWDHAN